MPTIEINKFDIMSVAKVGAIIGLIWGIIAGLIAAIGTGAISGMIPGMGMMLAGTTTVVAFIGTLIGMVIYGFVGGAITAFFYNLAAGWVGGIEFEH
ncbi:MAG: hypothetical protein ACOCTT_03145 [archaeon]